LVIRAVESEQCVELRVHGAAQRSKEPAKLRQIPLVAGDALGEVEKRFGKQVSNVLVVA